MDLPFRLPLARPLGAALLCLVLAAAPAAAEPPAAPAPAAAAPVPVASLWNTAYRGVENCLKTRAGLLQFGVVGMVVALVIIMFNNKWSK